tara:strand:- start:1448 stop:1714 length:267 start_codon:yes stop_codon:yes gene_type:complete
MKNETAALDALIQLVVKASEHCPAELAPHLINAMDTVEAEHDELKEELAKVKEMYRKKQKSYDKMWTQLMFIRADHDRLLRKEAGIDF